MEEEELVSPVLTWPVAVSVWLVRGEQEMLPGAGPALDSLARPLCCHSQPVSQCRAVRQAGPSTTTTTTSSTTVPPHTCTTCSTIEITLEYTHLLQY